MKKYINVGIFLLIIVGLILFKNYYDIKNSNIKLNGSDIITLNLYDEWIDPMVDTDKDVIVNSNVNLNGIGEYEVNYEIKIGLFTRNLKRKVIVVSEDEKADLNLNIKGELKYYLMKGAEYKDLEIEALDKYDGDITSLIKKEGVVDNEKEGIYKVSYSIIDTNGIKKRIIQEVIVYSFDFKGRLKYKEEVKENEIIINIDDSNYNYTLLPNKEIDKRKEIHYLVKENGTYNFSFYDKNNHTFNYEVEVSNIDNTAPKGTCVLSLFDNNGEIKVVASDDKNIKGYIYQYGNNKTDLITSDTFNFNTMDESASVEIFDNALNSTIIKCEVIDKSTVISSSYQSYNYNFNGKNYGYWLYLPKNNTKRKKMPMLVYLHGDGGRTKNINDVNLHSFPNFIKNGMDFPFIMLAPHCTNEANFSDLNMMEYIVSVINYISNNYNVDVDRIILGGGSSGANGAYKMAANYKNLFSSLVIGSGVVYTIDPPNLTYLPIWIFHGTNDSHIPYNEVVNKVNLIKNAGGNVTFTTIQNGTHEITEEVFKYRELTDWMISQKRKTVN